MSIKKFFFILAVAASVAGGSFGALSPNLDNTIVYPNPFRPSSGQTSVTFGNLTASARLRVYKITGEVVYDAAITAAADGTYLWGAVNSDGEALATGVYVYMVTNDNGGKNIGKLAIVR